MGGWGRLATIWVHLDAVVTGTNVEEEFTDEINSGEAANAERGTREAQTLSRKRSSQILRTRSIAGA